MADKKKLEVFKHLSHGVNIVTTKCGETLNGFTASWIMQCSSDPPMLAVGVKKTHRSYELIRKANIFAVNILNSGQKHIAEQFFGPPERHAVADKFAGFEHMQKATGSPILAEALAYVDCKLVGAFEFGDHAIFVGEALEAEQLRKGTPLLVSECGWHYLG